VFYFILLSELIGYFIECKKKHGTSNVKQKKVSKRDVEKLGMKLPGGLTWLRIRWNFSFYKRREFLYHINKK